MAQSVIATITDIARTKFAGMLSTGQAFTITDFVTGSGGHDPSDPAVALTPDPSSTSLPLQSFGPVAITASTLITPFCVQYQADQQPTDAVGALSNIGLIATVTYSPIPNDPTVGTTFLFCVANFPLQIKTDSQGNTFLIQVNF